MSYIFGLNREHDCAVQLKTAVIHDGGLASSTLDEAYPWGKVAKDTTHAMAWVEPGVSNKWQNGALKQLRAQ
jgi:deoxyhypusine synthase